MAERKQVRGVLQGQEIRNTNWRDSRTFGERFSDGLEKPNTGITIMIIIASIMFIYPALLEVAFIIGMLLMYSISKKKVILPFRLPKSSGLIDYNSPLPNGGYAKGSGVIFLGNEMGTRKELWLNDSDARTHFLIFGSTGAGKALRKEEKVLTLRGWVKNKDLVIGDYVMRPNGEWSKITGIYDQGLSQLYSFELEDGREIKITSEHLWEVFDFNKVQNNKEDNNISGEVVKTFNIQERLLNGENLAINTVGKIDLPEVKLEHDMSEVIYKTVLSSIKNEEFIQDVSTILNGSHSQREFFFYQYKNEIKKQYGFTLGHYTYDVIGFNNEKNANLIKQIAHSLGFYAKVVKKSELGFNTYNLNEDLTHFLYIKEVDFIKIKDIKTTNEFEDCQCIKIEASDGLFVTKDYIVTHNTETLLSLAFNTLVHGSGFIYVDGKGDSSLYMKIFSMTRSMGREDDLVVLNYMTGSRDVSGPQSNKISNTLNPLSTGTSNGLTELIVGLMGGGGGGGDGDMWKGRAIAMVSAIMRALVWKRDNQGLLLDVVKLRDSLLLENIQKLAQDSSLPSETISALMAYLQSLPGYNVESDTQESTVLEQHGYLQMQFTRILGSLSDDYGYIFKTDLGEIDFKDIILNNRIFCVLLPALEKSPDELGNLGKIVVACLKIMMSTGLGDTLEGETARIIDTKPTTSPVPFMCILDEYGYYVVSGAAVMPAQARSIGFSMVFAGQDYPSFKKNNNSEEASATIGNCNIKIFMKVEDPGDTFELAKKSGGEATSARSTQQERSTGVFGDSFNDTLNISYNKESRLDWLDLKDQTEGQAHIIFKSTMIRAAMFYANPKKPAYLRLNHFIKVAPPTHQEVEEHIKPASNLDKKLRNRTLMNDILSGGEDPEIKILSKLIKDIDKNSDLNNAQKFAAVVASSLNTNTNMVKSLLTEVENSIYETKDHQMNIFDNRLAEGDDDDDYDVTSSYHLSEAIMSSDYNINDQSALLKEKNLVENIKKVESYSSNNTSSELQNKSQQAINDFTSLTSYPENEIPNETPDGLVSILDNLLDDIKKDN